MGKGSPQPSTEWPSPTFGLFRVAPVPGHSVPIAHKGPAHGSTNPGCVWFKTRELNRILNYNTQGRLPQVSTRSSYLQPASTTLLPVSSYPTPLRGCLAPCWGLSPENANAVGFSLRYLTRPSKFPVWCPWDFQWSQPCHHESCRICPRERTLPQTHKDSASMLNLW